MDAGRPKGLAFSVAPGVALPPSLRNIFRRCSAIWNAAPAFP